MAHAQKTDFVFRRNGRVHLNRRGRQFIRLLASEVCASAVGILDTPCSEVVREYWLPNPFSSFPFTSPPVRHRVPSGFKRTLQCLLLSSHCVRYNHKISKLPSTQIVSVMALIWQLVSTSEGHLQASSKKYI